MEVTSATSSSSSKTNTQNSALTNLSEELNNFYELLGVQLQNQDPLNPMDTNQMTDQIVNFTQAEQQVQTNEKLDELIASVKLTEFNNLVSYVGRTVEYSGDSIVKSAEEQSQAFTYVVDQRYSEVNVLVKDENGNVVYNDLGKAEPGTQTFVWDGKDEAGNHAPTGIYTISVTGRSSAGTLKDLETIVAGAVYGVNVEGENPTLVVNGDEIPVDEVKFISL